jgi:hypothetical protein
VCAQADHSTTIAACRTQHKQLQRLKVHDSSSLTTLATQEAQYVYNELRAVATISGRVGCQAMFSTFQLKLVEPVTWRLS